MDGNVSRRVEEGRTLRRAGEKKVGRELAFVRDVWSCG